MNPYIVTTRPKTQDVGDGIPGWNDADATRRAVAALDGDLQVRGIMVKDREPGGADATFAVYRRAEYGEPWEQVTGEFAHAAHANEAKRQIRNLPEQGGEVGPLPDGTVIEVERVSWPELAGRVAGADRPLPVASPQRVLDAYNAAQDVKAPRAAATAGEHDHQPGGSGDGNADST